MNITKSELIEYSNAFDVLIKNSDSKVLVYKLMKNKNKYKSELESLEKAEKSESRRFEEYQKKMTQIIFEYGKKNEQGNVKLLNNGIGFQLENEEKRKEVQSKIDDLNDEYKEAIEKRKEEYIKFTETLKEEIEVEFEKLPLSEIPTKLENEELKTAIEKVFDLIEE